MLQGSDNEGIYSFDWGIKKQGNPGRVAKLFGVLSHTPKGCGFHPWLGHIPETTHQCFSFSLSDKHMLK